MVSIVTLILPSDPTKASVARCTWLLTVLHMLMNERKATINSPFTSSAPSRILLKHSSRSLVECLRPLRAFALGAAAGVGGAGAEVGGGLVGGAWVGVGAAADVVAAAGVGAGV